MQIAMRTCISAAISLTVLLFSGCAELMPAPVSTAKLEEPVVQPEPCVSTETTSLQRYQELSQSYEAEKTRSAGLAAELAEQKTARQKAETENEGLRHQVESLTAKAAELDLLKTKFDEVQKTGFEVENSLRDVKRQLLEERLAGVKREETIVALKIERAKDLRKSPVERALQLPEEKPPQDTATEKPVSQNGPVSGGNAVVNP
ncbi:MAG: hypothetical protein ABSA67_11060 [Candidatus Brocadiia bacterium]|jgi:chromosome segregation ATPase